MIEITYGDVEVTVEFPSEWHELDSKQWHSIMNVLEGADVTVGEREKRMRNCLLLLGDSSDAVLFKEILEEMDMAQLYTMYEGIEMLTAPQILEKNHMPYIGILRGPRDHFAKMRWKEFGLLQEQIEAWGSAMENEDEKSEVRAMCCVFAIAYRLPLTPFSSRMSDVYLWLWPLFVRKKTMMRMMRVILGLMQNLKEIYPETYDIKESSDSPNLGFRGLSLSLAGPKFGDFYKLQRAELHDVMTEMEQQAFNERKNEEIRKTNGD